MSTMFNINSFRANGLRQGGARPTQFSVRFDTLPPGVGQGDIAIQLEYLIRSASLPENELGRVEVPFFGRKIKFAGDREFADWQVTVMNDEDFKARSMFENWSNKMNALISNRMDPALGDETAYKVDAMVFQYGKMGPGNDAGIIRSYKFVGIWPSVVSAIDVDWDATNMIETFDVRLVYDYFEPIDFGGGEEFSTELSDG